MENYQTYALNLSKKVVKTLQKSRASSKLRSDLDST